MLHQAMELVLNCAILKYSSGSSRSSTRSTHAAAAAAALRARAAVYVYAVHECSLRLRCLHRRLLRRQCNSLPGCFDCCSTAPNASSSYRPDQQSIDTSFYGSGWRPARGGAASHRGHALDSCQMPSHRSPRTFPRKATQKRLLISRRAHNKSARAKDPVHAISSILDIYIL